MTRTIVCPLCIQWRCAVTHGTECPDDFCDYDHEQEPYWPDGSVATLTQQDWCDRCAQAVADYQAENDRERRLGGLA